MLTLTADPDSLSSSLQWSWLNDTFNPDNITPDLFYYAGIMYYRMLPDQSPLKNIHFLILLAILLNNE